MAKKATITLMDASGSKPDTNHEVEVDFHPQSLRLNYRTLGALGTQNAKDATDAQSTRTQATGFTASLSVELLFDTSETGRNVREKTARIAAMIQAQEQGRAPVVQFLWGDFLFRGTIQSMDETLDFFSEQGVPLRATVSLSLSGNRPDLKEAQGSGASAIGAGLSASASFGVSAGAGLSAGATFSAGASVGTTPLTLTQSGDTLQGLAASTGADWKAVARANGIDNPRRVPPGTVINLNASADIKGG